MSGSVDYMDLFTPAAPWGTAASHVQVFKVYASVFTDGYLTNSLSDDNIRQMLADITRRHMALAVEWGPLTPQFGCGAGFEGFDGASALKLANRIRDLGGILQYITMDGPFFHAGLFSSTSPQVSCDWTAAQVAANAVQQIAIIKTVFPNVVVGDTERVPAAGYNPDWLNQYQLWFDAWQTAYGQPLAFFQADVDRGAPDWIEQVEAIRKALASRGITFGMIYNGLATDQSDSTWTQDAINLFLDYELHAGVIPGQAVFQSWDSYPKYLLPETSPATFTSVIDLYFRQRTSLALATAGGQVTGVLSDSAGHPIPSAPIALVLQPTSGAGIVSNYTLTGTVPASMNQAYIQMCVNYCEGSTGTNDMSLYTFHYVDSSQHVMLGFSNGLTGWAVTGGAPATATQITSDGNGYALTVFATPDEKFFVNSDPFAVTPGSDFTLTIQARISPYSTGSGVFAVTFPASDPRDNIHVALPYSTGTIPLAAAQTGIDGAFSTTVPVQKTEGFQVQASYAGTDVLWPAFGSASQAATPTIDPDGVMSAADFKVEAMSPGAWFSVFGRNLGAYGQWAAVNTTALGGASVTVCGSPAVISYNSGPVRTSDGSERWQLNALLPDSVAGQTSCPVTVTALGQTTQPVTIGIAAGVLELFTFPYGKGQLPIVTHTDYSMVGPSNGNLVAAQPGETLVAWGTGDCGTPKVTVGGVRATVEFSGAIGPGLCQINFVVPAGLSGANTLAISTSPNIYLLWLGN